jgi:hypothetical protein
MFLSHQSFVGEDFDTPFSYEQFFCHVEKDFGAIKHPNVKALKCTKLRLDKV